MNKNTYNYEHSARLSLSLLSPRLSFVEYALFLPAQNENPQGPHCLQSMSSCSYSLKSCSVPALNYIYSLVRCIGAVQLKQLSRAFNQTIVFNRMHLSIKVHVSSGAHPEQNNQDFTSVILTPLIDRGGTIPLFPNTNAEYLPILILY